MTLAFGFIDAFEVEGAERHFALSVVFVRDDHGVEWLSVQRVDVGATVLQVRRPGPAQRTIVAVGILDFWRVLFSENIDKWQFLIF